MGSRNREAGDLIAEIIGVGQALLDGQTLDTVADLIAEQLEGCGVQTEDVCAAGSDPVRLRGAIGRAIGRSDIVVLVGGLGMTPADISKETVCAGLGRRLVLHEESQRRIREAYLHAGRQMPQQAVKLAMMPEQSIVFPGVKGVTPGCAISAGRQFLLMIPDNPDEFLPMFHKSIVPYLSRFSPAAVFTRTLSLFGIEEAELRTLLEGYLDSENPKVELFPSNGEFLVRITANAENKEEAAELLNPVLFEIRAVLGGSVYGVDVQGGLPAATAALLQERGIQVNVGESGTNGLLADLLTGQSDGRVVAYSVSAYASHVKKDALGIPDKVLKRYSPVSEQIAVHMAHGALQQENAAFGVAVTCNTALRGEDPKKNGLLYAAVCDGKQVWVRRVLLPQDSSGDYVRHMAAMHTLNLLRLCAGTSGCPGGIPVDEALDPKFALPKQENAFVSARKWESGSKPAPVLPSQNRAWYAAVFPVKGDTPGAVFRKLLLLAALVVFLGSAAFLIHYYLSGRSNAALYDELRQVYLTGADDQQAEEAVARGKFPAGYQSKFLNLYQTNEDLVGWLSVGKNLFSYPVVQADDNERYLNTNFQNKSSRYGTPMLDAGNSLASESDNYLIYGHNMSDGQMFAGLTRYKPAEGGLGFLNANPTISFADVYEDNEYEIVSVFITNVTDKYGDVFYYNDYQDLSDPARFIEFTEEVTARSFYTSDIEIQPGDRFLTLSTCSYEYGPKSRDADVRTVVVARRLRDGESPSASYALNPSPRMPSGFTDHQGGQSAPQDADSIPSSGNAADVIDALAPVVDPDSLDDHEYSAYAAYESIKQALVDAEQAAKATRQAAQKAASAADEASAQSEAEKAALEMKKAEDAYWRIADHVGVLNDLREERSTEYIESICERAQAALVQAEAYRDASSQSAAQAGQTGGGAPVASMEVASSAPSAGSSAPAPSSTPAPSSSAPALSSSAPAPGSSVPAPSSSAPAPSSSVPVSSSSAPAPSSSAPAPSSSAPAPSSSAPAPSSSTPAPSSSRPVPSSSVPVKPVVSSSSREDVAARNKEALEKTEEYQQTLDDVVSDAREVREIARDASDEAYDAKTAKAVRTAADRIEDALEEIRSLCGEVEDTSDGLKTLYQRTNLQQTREAVQDAADILEVLEEYESEVEELWVDADNKAYKLENEPSSSASSSSSGSSSGSSSKGDEDDEDDRPTSAGELTISISGKKTTGSASEIVQQVVMAEMGSSFNDEAIKAQAVAAYSYILHQNRGGTIPALGVKTPNDRMKKLVDSVIGEAVYYNGSLAFTPFYATSAGITVSSEDTWGGSYPYLVSVDSSVDEQAGGYERTVTMSTSKVAERIKKILKEDIYDYSDDPEDWIEILSYSKGGRYVRKVRIGKDEVSGRYMRENVFGLRSAAFEVVCDGDSFQFTTYGYGHGVGMSQTGANLYAAKGWDYVDILTHYYPGTTVK